MIVGVPVQEPTLAVSVSPILVMPLMLGSSVFFGSAPIALVAADVADVDPPPLVAVTITRTVSPTSVEMSPRTASVAPLMLLQASPLALQSCHWSP